MPHYWPYVAFGCGLCLGPNIWTLSYSNTVTKFITWITRLRCRKVTMMWGLHMNRRLSEVMMYEQREERHKRKNSPTWAKPHQCSLTQQYYSDEIAIKTTYVQMHIEFALYKVQLLRESALFELFEEPSDATNWQLLVLLQITFPGHTFLNLSSNSKPPRILKYLTCSYRNA